MYAHRSSTLTSIPGRRTFVVMTFDARKGEYEVIKETSRRAVAEKVAMRLTEDGEDVVLSGPGIATPVVPFKIQLQMEGK